MKQDREQALAARLSIVQKLSLAEAMELLDISESTARRMFAKLEQDGVAIRTHGGIQSVNHALTSYSFEYGAKKNIDKKTAIARVACDYLEDMGVLTEVAINGKEAYNMISTGERYDAVLMDVRMPIMDGYEATDMIRKLDNDYARKLIIIAITANAFEEDVQKSYNAGMNYHISKPINPKMLYDVLVELMQKTNDIEEQEGEMYE